MPSGLELAANLLVAGSIWLAARNSALTWWATIAGCALFAVLCYQHQLYADVVLQLFFILAAVWGLCSWRSEQALPIRQLPSKYLVAIPDRSFTCCRTLWRFITCLDRRLCAVLG